MGGHHPTIKMPASFVEPLHGPASVLGALLLCSAQSPKADSINLGVTMRSLGPRAAAEAVQSHTETQAGCNTVLTKDMLTYLLLLLFSRYAVFNSLQPHGLQRARLLCPSPSPRVCSDSCPLSR